MFALALLALNFYVGSRATEPASRVRVPYSPFFLNQVSAGHVKEITSKGTAIQGTFTQKERFGKSKPTTRFRTEIPAFADNNALSKLLQEKGVVVNAQPLDTGAPWWQNLLLGFGPTILFVFLLFWLMRRAGNAQNILGSFGRSRIRRVATICLEKGATPAALSGARPSPVPARDADVLLWLDDGTPVSVFLPDGI